MLLAQRLRRPRGDMSTLPSVLSRPYLGESGIVLHRGHRQLFKKPVHTTPWGPGVERGVRGDLRGLSTRSPVQYVTRQMCNKFAHHDHFLARGPKLAFDFASSLCTTKLFICCTVSGLATRQRPLSRVSDFRLALKSLSRKYVVEACSRAPSEPCLGQREPSRCAWSCRSACGETN